MGRAMAFRLFGVRLPLESDVDKFLEGTVRGVLYGLRIMRWLGEELAVMSDLYLGSYMIVVVDGLRV